MKTTRILSSLAALTTIAALVGPETARSQDTMLASAVAAEAKEISSMKSEDAATLLSLAGTVLPISVGILLQSAESSGGDGSPFGAVLLSYGLFFGPATGYWYAGNSTAGLKGAGIRLGILLATGATIAAICSGDNCSIFGPDTGATTAAGVVALVGLGTLTYSMIHDIAGVGDHVRAHNAMVSARQGQQPRLTIAPLVSPADGGTVGVFGRFRL
ncbi:MAG: hypothetical protein KAI98_08360 [Gemmatimonadetes bacterium]|nr:hypothetical protein [Gemmatimonadota bacterium]